jgi:peptidoglycan/LPS O-acetylase OafA/YrhL
MAAGVVVLWANWRTGQDLALGREVGKYAAVAVLCWPLLIAGLALTGRGPARFLSRDAMVYGGRISYCLYLVHWVVRDIGMAVIARDPAAPGAGAYTPGGALTVPVLIAVCFAGAAGLHRFVEEPARRRLVRLWDDRGVVRTAAAGKRSQSVTTGEGAAAAGRLTPLHVTSGRLRYPTAPLQPRTVAPKGGDGARVAAGDGQAAGPRG